MRVGPAAPDVTVPRPAQALDGDPVTAVEPSTGRPGAPAAAG
ncbi:MAG TPA: hypothetical protein VER97_15660 [Geodermatophilus sp.]|nr:hypothetical protein [Geodermatophilus sp.]